MTRRQTWILFVVYLCLIYLSLPIMRDLVNFIKELGMVDSLTYGVNIAIGVAMGVLLWWRVSQLRWWNYLVLIAVAVILTYMVMQAKWPAERIHFFQYGILASIAYVGFSFDFSPMYSLFLSTLLVAGCGWGDEGIQHLLPRRHYNLHDVLYNAIGAGLGAVTLYAGFPGLAKYVRAS